jgi:hypothetical protein
MNQINLFYRTESYLQLQLMRLIKQHHSIMSVLVDIRTEDIINCVEIWYLVNETIKITKYTKAMKT